jgi:aspartyl-tRNA(Asn)/glutamyl-tRNA(Gln) amidotransferase subunit A
MSAAQLPLPEMVDPARDPVCFLSVTELAARYRNGSLSPVEVVTAMLARIERLNPELAAYYELHPDWSLAEARASELRWRAGAPLGGLDGVPVSVKDHLEVRGWKNARGHATDKLAPVTIDSPVAARLREAGAVMMGKTTMPELSVIPVTTTRAWGATRNPWNTDHSAGGSSGGAAAAVAAGLCTIAMGSDGGGSIRLPASFAALVGHKPTLGRVPYFPGQTDRTVAGPLARSAADVAAAMNVVARPDGRDWMELVPDSVDYSASLESRPRGLRVAWSGDFGYQTVDPEVAALAEAALARLDGIAAGIDPVRSVCADPFRIYMSQAALRLRQTPRSDGEPRAIASVLDFAARLTPEDLQHLVDERNRLGVAFTTLFSNADILVSPTSPVTAPRIGELYPDADTLGEANRNLIGFCAPINLVHLPAISVPCGFTRSGMPVGLQLAGPKGSDALLLRVANAMGA